MKRGPGLNSRLRLPKGFAFAATTAGLKKHGGPDLALIEAPIGAAAAAVFTSNRVVAAPIKVGRRSLRATGGHLRAVLVNSGNANCATGSTGLRACERTCRILDRLLGVAPAEVFPSSTGAIGVPFPAERIERAVPALLAERRHSRGALACFARAILTTDTRPKLAWAQVRCAGGQVRLAGVAKGAGMIHPRLATMLVYLFTDVTARPAQLQRWLRAACARTFNRISVDGDTSTNDIVLLLASGAT